MWGITSSSGYPVHDGSGNSGVGYSHHGQHNKKGQSEQNQIKELNQSQQD
jgi:hypothetical protein